MAEGDNSAAADNSESCWIPAADWLDKPDKQTMSEAEEARNEVGQFVLGYASGD